MRRPESFWLSDREADRSSARHLVRLPVSFLQASGIVAIYKYL